jgi:hypothetical protein
MFALVHTKLRNLLGYEKLDRLVYVHYNLKFLIQQFVLDNPQEKEIDPYSVMMDVVLFYENNPILEWFSNSRSESRPILDGNDDDNNYWDAPGNFSLKNCK